MVRVNGPALSLDASGTLAQSMVFSKWKGRNYVRSHVKPAQPRTGPQVGVRAMFKFLAQAWKGDTGAHHATWLVPAKQANVSEFNASQQYNQKRWRNFLTPTKAFPAALASTAPTIPTVALTPGIRQMTIVVTKGATVATYGYTIHRYPVTGTSAAFSNCVAVIAKVGAGTDTYVDTPLASGIYFYKVIPFNDDGVQGTVSAEATATVP